MTWKPDDITNMISNPSYCLPDSKGEVIITEELWIKAATRRIKEDGDGGAKFLGELLGHLRSAC